MKPKSQNWIMASELHLNADQEGTALLELRSNRGLDLRNLSLEEYRMSLKSLGFW